MVARTLGTTVRSGDKDGGHRLVRDLANLGDGFRHAVDDVVETCGGWQVGPDYVHSDEWVDWYCECTECGNDTELPTGSWL